MHGANFAEAKGSSVDPQTRDRRPIVWPAYLVAAVCFAVAVSLSLINLSLIEQLKAAQSHLALAGARANGLVRDLASERGTLADLMDDDAQHFDITGGQVVRIRGHLYVTMHDLAQPPRGRVYEAWTQPKNSTTLQPALTFVPDSHGVAVVSIPVDAKDVGAIEITLEPDGGSKAPTSKPLVLEPLN
ncbi:MAG TPA: anti-sigma factor [Candidatus Acidoferrum sp.]|nr:anti-sigma factor [Candidatus Acidoferrum sp.]